MQCSCRAELRAHNLLIFNEFVSFKTLLVEDYLNSENYIFEIYEGAPSQYLKQVLAVKLGVPEKWDQRTCPYREDVSKTYIKLRKTNSL